MSCPKKINSLLRKYDFSFEKRNISKKDSYLLRKYNSIKYITNSKKMTYLLRKYSPTIQKYLKKTKKTGGQVSGALAVISQGGPG